MNMKFAELYNILTNYDKENLPGKKAHQKLAPKIGDVPFRNFKPADNSKQSAVMVLLLKDFDENLSVLFTLRSEKLKSHQGQISFPGGRMENNETPLNAALRETKEEIGINSEEINVLFQLSDLYVPPSNSIIHPFVGVIPHNLKFNLSKNEVKEIIVKDLDFFLDDSNSKEEYWEFNGRVTKIPLWHIHSKTPLWGATAMILNEFLEIIKGSWSITKSIE